MRGRNLIGGMRKRDESMMINLRFEGMRERRIFQKG